MSYRNIRISISNRRLKINFKELKFRRILTTTTLINKSNKLFFVGGTCLYALYPSEKIIVAITNTRAGVELEFEKILVEIF